MTLRFPSIFLSVSDLFCSPSQPRRTSPQKNSANFIEKYLVDSKKRPTFAAQNQNMVSIAQLVRASDCGSEGRGFDPHCSPKVVMNQKIHHHFSLSIPAILLAQAESTVHMLNWAIRSVKFLGVEFD